MQMIGVVFSITCWVVALVEYFRGNKIDAIWFLLLALSWRLQ